MPGWGIPIPSIDDLTKIRDIPIVGPIVEKVDDKVRDWVGVPHHDAQPHPDTSHGTPGTGGAGGAGGSGGAGGAGGAGGSGGAGGTAHSDSRSDARSDSRSDAHRSEERRVGEARSEQG